MQPNENSNLDKFIGEETRMNKGLALFQRAKKTMSENADGSFSVPSQTVEEIAYTVRLMKSTLATVPILSRGTSSSESASIFMQ